MTVMGMSCLCDQACVWSRKGAVLTLACLGMVAENDWDWELVLDMIDDLATIGLVVVRRRLALSWPALLIDMDIVAVVAGA